MFYYGGRKYFEVSVIYLPGARILFQDAII